MEIPENDRFEALETRMTQLEERVEALADGEAALPSRAPLASLVSEFKTLNTHYLCPCGQPAVMTFSFPGEMVQGRCETHEAGTMLRKEIEPGRIHVASVTRVEEQQSRVD